MKQLICILSLSALLLVSCSKTSTPTSTTPTSTKQITATINGVSTSFNTGITGIMNAGGFSVGGQDASGETINIGNGGSAPTVGTYDIGDKTATYGIKLTLLTGTPRIYDSYNPTTNKTTKKMGSVTISSVSSTSIQGTFYGTIPLNSGSPDSVFITNGTFDVTF